MVVKHVAFGGDAWLRSKRARATLELGAWFVQDGTTSPTLVALAAEAHAEIRGRRHWVARGMFELDVDPEGNRAYASVLHRLHESGSDEAWPAAVVTALMHVSHPKGYCAKDFPDLASIHGPDGDQAGRIDRAIARLSPERRRFVAGTIARNIHAALYNVWDERTGAGWQANTRLGADDTPVEPCVPPVYEGPLDPYENMAAVEFFDEGDFPYWYSIHDLGRYPGAIDRMFVDEDQWTMMAGDAAHLAMPAPRLAGGTMIRMFAQSSVENPYDAPVGLRDLNVHGDGIVVIIEVSPEIDDAPMRIHVHLVAVRETSGNGYASDDQRQNNCLAVALSYLQEILPELDKTTPPGGTARLVLTPERKEYDELMMAIEAQLGTLATDDDLRRDWKWHGYRIDVRRAPLGDDDGLPLLGAYVPPRHSLAAWEILEAAMDRLAYADPLGHGRTILFHDGSCIGASWGTGSRTVDVEDLDAAATQAFDVVASRKTEELLDEMTRRLAWPRRFYLIRMLHSRTYAIKENDLTFGFRHLHPGVAIHNAEPDEIAERAAALRFWRTYLAGYGTQLDLVGFA